MLLSLVRKAQEVSAPDTSCIIPNANSEPSSIPEPTSIGIATKIVSESAGAERFVSQYEANQIWKRVCTPPQLKPRNSLLYSQKTIRHAFSRPFGEISQTWCVFIHGFSLAEFAEMKTPFGMTGHLINQCDWHNALSFFGNLQTPADWMKTRPLPGYYIFEIERHMPHTSWYTQEIQLSCVSPYKLYQRAHTAMLLEAVATIDAARGINTMKKASHIGEAYPSGMGNEPTAISVCRGERETFRVKPVSVHESMGSMSGVFLSRRRDFGPTLI